MAVTSTPRTLEEFLKLPEEKPALEFADGVITQKVSPKGHHSILQAELIERINHAGLPGKRTRAFPELRVTFAGASYVPDVSVYRWQRIPVDADGRIANDFFEPPDVTVEIVSPNQSVNALVRRCLWYVAHGVQVTLLVDPKDDSVLTFRADRPASEWHGSDRIDLGDILPDLDLTVEQLFASLRQG